MSVERWSENTVKSLLSCSIHKAVDDITKYEDTVITLPPNLKDKLIHLMSKRGLLKDNNIHLVVHINLRTLDLSDSDIGHLGLMHVATHCKNLRKIDLNAQKVPRTSITADGIISLAHSCPHLEVIYLRRCPNVDDGVVSAIANSCPRLRDLNIGGCPLVTDVSLVALGQMSACLRSINFSKSNVTDDGVLSLVSGACCASLREVHMSGCVTLTDEAVEAVVQFCSQIAVLIFHGCPKLTDRSRLALEEILDRSKMKQVTWTIY